jgi:hypothetical protein
MLLYLLYFASEFEQRARVDVLRHSTITTTDNSTTAQSGTTNTSTPVTR